VLVHRSLSDSLPSLLVTLEFTFQPLCYKFTKFNWQVIELATIGFNRVCDVGAITKDTWQLIALKGLWMGWCPSLKEILDGMVMNLLQNGSVYMVVDHTITFPSNFPQNVKIIDVISAKNLYKDHNTLECGVIVALKILNHI